jgi:hypothetical protein
MAPGIGETLRRIFSSKAPGAGKQAVEETVPYKGYMVRPAPQKEGSQWLVAGVITKTVDDEVKEHKFVRGDLYPSREGAVEYSITKGQQIIDLEGDRIFE